MAVSQTDARPAAPDATKTGEIIISADSHVMEPPDLWVSRLPAEFRDRAPSFPQYKVGEGFQQHAGGWDPHERIKEMEVDGVSAEVLYPTLGLNLYALEDAPLQEACFRVYNDWLIDYCRVSPHRLVGLAAISVYDIDYAVAELERCRRAGLRGAVIWQSPHPDLPLRSEHYERLWAAAQDMDLPIHMHILSGPRKERGKGPEHYRTSVNLKILDAMNALYDLTFYGVLHRYPRLRFVIVETEIGWLPFILQQWDYYWRRFCKADPVGIDREPSRYFERQVYATFFNDAVGGQCLAWWGQDNCMWSNDFPHPNSTWPRSHEVIAQHLGHLPPEVRAKVVRENVARLYGFSLPLPAPATQTEGGDR